MIESLFTSQSSTNTQRVLTYVKNERMGGYVPKYEYVEIAKNDITQNSADAMAGALGEDTLSYQPTGALENADDQFGFADLIDMVNPLHHVPVVGHVYRELTGDEIKPISKIVGGAAFGGPMGVATALIDTVITEETGQDMAQNAMGMAFGSDEQLTEQSFETQFAQNNNPEVAIENAFEAVDDYEMTSALLAYSDLGTKTTEMLKYDAAKRVQEVMESPLATPREPITQVSLSDKGGLYAL